MNTGDMVRLLLLLAGTLLLVYLLKKQNLYDFEGYNDNRMNNFADNMEQNDFQNMNEPLELPVETEQMSNAPGATGNMETMEEKNTFTDMSKPYGARMGGCFPKDQLNAKDLLPADEHSIWAKITPEGQGSLASRNLIEAGYHIGTNTVSNTLRNASHDLRSEPPNPQVKVSPWLQATIGPDKFRKPLEIGPSPSF